MKERTVSTMWRNTLTLFFFAMKLILWCEYAMYIQWFLLFWWIKRKFFSSVRQFGKMMINVLVVCFMCKRATLKNHTSGVTVKERSPTVKVGIGEGMCIDCKSWSPDDFLQAIVCVYVCRDWPERALNKNFEESCLSNSGILSLLWEFCVRDNENGK